MIKDFKKIVVVGGGSSGWMTASALKKYFNDVEVVVIESPEYPIVSVGGESTLAGIKDFVNFIELDEKDFMQYCNASYNLTIKFTDFYDKNSGSFHYPLGKPVWFGTANGVNDWSIKKFYYPETPNSDAAECFFPAVALANANKFTDNSGTPEEQYSTYFDPKTEAAYHFDATKFGQYLKEKYCIPRGVKLIQKTVKNVSLNELGIEYLILNDDEKIYADLFVDCTGFKRLLLGQFLNEPFISWNDILPNNRAWATQLPYIDKEKELEPYTNCTAIENGWVWNIPLWSRIGTGYVYSDKFISPEDAKEQFKNYLKSNKMTVPRTQEQVDSLEFKDIEMKVGIHERTFVKNVVAIGLSAGFIEPLESNGLLTVHEFIFRLLKVLSRRTITNWDRDTYNRSVYYFWRNFAEFVSLHYALSIRNDTEYWIENSKRDYIKKKHYMDFEHASNEYFDLQFNKMVRSQYELNPGITWICMGMNYLPIEDVTADLQSKHNWQTNWKEYYKSPFDVMEERKKIWNEGAKKVPTLYEFLKNKIYLEE
jgi:flavin-dependent dehydrogenase